MFSNNHDEREREKERERASADDVYTTQNEER